MSQSAASSSSSSASSATNTAQSASAASAVASSSGNPQVAALNDLLRQWEANHTQSGWNPAPVLAAMATLVETETDNYMKTDPDPFDERHPSRVSPACTLGQLFRVVCKKDAFMDKLVLDYTRENYWHRSAAHAASTGGSPGAAAAAAGTGVATSDSQQQPLPVDSTELNTQATRLLLGVMAGLETSVVFQDADTLIQRLFGWLETADREPLASYAAGLLAVAMHIQDLAGSFREANMRLVPLAMRRLKQQQELYLGPADTAGASFSDTGCSPARSPHPVMTALTVNENSNSSWAELAPQLISTYQLYPLTPVAQQVLLLQYLTPLGEYQEWLGLVLEHRMLHVIVRYLDSRQPEWHATLAFEALRYLSSLLCHKKFTLEFLSGGGIFAVLCVPRPGVAATGVSMCLYYLAYSEDAMERICQMPDAVVAKLVIYALWLLECSHESGRCHATMFFGLSFQFRAVLNHFDRHDGMRKLLNVVSTLRMLTSAPGAESSADETDDQFPARQIMRHVCAAIRCYLHAQLVTKAEQVRQAMEGAPHNPHSLTVTVTSESVQKALDLFASAAVPSGRVRWRPVTAFLRLGGLKMLLHMMDVCQDIQFAGKHDTLCAALDCVTTCCVLPAAQLQLCERCTFPVGRTVTGIALVIGLTDPDVGDAQVQKAALRVLINCVSRTADTTLSSPEPSAPAGGVSGASSSTTPLPLPVAAAAANTSVCRREDVLSVMWDAVRNNNGIMALMNLVQTKTPITDADAIRALACRALVGLARSESAKQIMSKLPLFASGSLQMTVREPILQEKRAEHVQLQRDCLLLLSLVSGRKSGGGTTRSVVDQCGDLTLDTIHRANVVAQTRIHYNEHQLLQLIHAHLASKGMSRSATMLLHEAGLSGHAGTPLAAAGAAVNHSSTSTPLRARAVSLTTAGTSTPANGPTHTSRANTPIVPHISRSVSRDVCSPSRISRLKLSSPAVPTGGFHQCPSPQSPAVTIASCPSPGCGVGSTPTASAAAAAAGTVSATVGDRGVSLHHIVTEYLMNQHALCRAPMVTCPQFDLLAPHCCPQPAPRRQAPLNLAARVLARSVFPRGGGLGGADYDTRLVYSRYCPMRTLRDTSDADVGGGGTGGPVMTCVAFCRQRRTVVVGDQEGGVRLFDRDTGQLDETFSSLHALPLTHVQTSCDDQLLVTCSRRRRPLSALWSIGGELHSQVQLSDMEFAEFSHGGVSDRLLATQRHSAPLNFTAHLYDVTSGTCLLQMKPRVGNGYLANRAVFCPHNDLVLNNGSLFDTRSGHELHKFDKFNNAISGVFHPTRPEIIANTEVWDLRTFHLLHTVPALNQCRLTLANHEPVLFGLQLNAGEMSASSSSSAAAALAEHMPEEVSAFRVVHAGSFASLATVDLRRQLHALSISSDDLQLATLESQLLDADFEPEHVTTVRLYDVGRQRGTYCEDGPDEEEADDDMEADNDDDDDDDEEDGDSSDDAMAHDIADALFGVRRSNRRSPLFASDSGSDSGSSFSMFSTSSEAEDASEDAHETADHSQNSWVTDDDE